MSVNIVPMPAWMRRTRFRPDPAPVFPDGEPDPDDIALALALFEELDPESQEWYGGTEFVARLEDRSKSANGAADAHARSEKDRKGA